MVSPERNGPDERIRILYVGGMPRSGSTLTDLILDQLPGHVGVGEVHYLWDDGLVRNAPCSCGTAFAACEFWQAVGDHAFGGWHEVDRDRVRVLRDRVDATRAIPQLLRPNTSPAFAAMRREYVEILTRLYRAILVISGKRVIVDSSKRPSLAYILRGTPEVDLKVAHVVRDPRGVAYSFGKHVEVDRGIGVPAEMPRSTARKVARRWVTVNALISALRPLGVPLVRIRYEDLVEDPHHHLERVLALEGSPVTADTFDFIENNVLQVPHAHTIAAGRVSRERGPIAISSDNAWQTRLGRRDRTLISALTAPSRLWYGY